MLRWCSSVSERSVPPRADQCFCVPPGLDHGPNRAFLHPLWIRGQSFTPPGRIRPAGTPRPAAQPARTWSERPLAESIAAPGAHLTLERRPRPPSPPTRRGFEDRATVPPRGQAPTTSAATRAEPPAPHTQPTAAHARSAADLTDSPPGPCPAGTTSPHRLLTGAEPGPLRLRPRCRGGSLATREPDAEIDVEHPRLSPPT